MGKWVTNGRRVFDNRDGWCAEMAGDADAERAKARHNADLTALEAERDEVRVRLEKVLAALKPMSKAPCDCETCYCGNYGDAQDMAAWNKQNALYNRAVAIAEGRG